MSRRSTARRRPSKARRPAMRGPAPAQLAAAMVDAVADDLAGADPLQAQLVASWLVADRLERHWDDLARADDDPDALVARPALGLVQLVAELREPSLRTPALALVLALASLDPEDDAVQEAAVEAVRRLRFLGATLPGWAEQVLAPDVTAAWCVRDVFSETMTIYVGARFAGDADDAAAHCIAARIEQRRFPELVEVFVAEDPDVLVPELERALAGDPQASLLRLEQLSLARAGALLADVVDDAAQSHGESLEDEAFDAFALLEARVALLRPQVEAAPEAELHADPHDSELDALTADVVVARFVDSHEYRSAPAADPVVAGLLVAWVVEHVDGPTARVGPDLVLELLSDLAASAATAEDRDLLLAHAVGTVAAWCRMCSRLTGLPDEALQELERVLDDARDEFARLVAQGADRPRLTDQLMELMLRDGVDVGSQEELDAWSDAWNALSDEQRIARLDEVG